MNFPVDILLDTIGRTGIASSIYSQASYLSNSFLSPNVKYLLHCQRTLQDQQTISSPLVRLQGEGLNNKAGLLNLLRSTKPNTNPPFYALANKHYASPTSSMSQVGWKMANCERRSSTSCRPDRNSGSEDRRERACPGLSVLHRRHHQKAEWDCGCKMVIDITRLVTTVANINRVGRFTRLGRCIRFRSTVLRLMLWMWLWSRRMLLDWASSDARIEEDVERGRDSRDARQWWQMGLKPEKRNGQENKLNYWLMQNVVRPCLLPFIIFTFFPSPIIKQLSHRQQEFWHTKKKSA